MDKETKERNELFFLKVCMQGNLKEVDRFIYDISVITYARLKEKKSNSERKKAELSRKNLSRILETLQWFYSNDIVINTTDTSDKLLSFFGKAPVYNEACRYFDEFLINEYNFDNGNSIIIDNDSKKLMCKDSNGRHILDEQHYLESRGKRLPFIRDSLERLNHCYEFAQEKGKKQQFIILNQYCYPIKGGQNYEYFIMILRRLGASV